MKGISTIPIGIGLAVLVAAVAMTLNPLSGLDFNNNCQWEDVDVNGNTYSTLDGFRSDWEKSSERSWSFVKENLDFRVESDTLQYRSCVENGGINS